VVLTVIALALVGNLWLFAIIEAKL
jgi:hypothetical protein